MAEADGTAALRTKDMSTKDFTRLETPLGEATGPPSRRTLWRTNLSCNAI
jgi:hypothetical protein